MVSGSVARRTGNNSNKAANEKITQKTNVTDREGLPMFITKEQRHYIEASIMEHNKRLELLESYADQCTSLHERAAKHWERQDASLEKQGETLRDLTSSNMRLANSLDLLNNTVVDIIKNDRPQTDFVKGWRTTMCNNKMIFISITAIVAFILSLAQLAKSIM